MVSVGCVLFLPIFNPDGIESNLDVPHFPSVAHLQIGIVFSVGLCFFYRYLIPDGIESNRYPISPTNLFIGQYWFFSKNFEMS